MRFEIDWASLIVGSKFIVFALFYSVFEGNFPRKSLCLEGRFNGGFFLRYEFGGLYLEGPIFGILRYPTPSCLVASSRLFKVSIKN